MKLSIKKMASLLARNDESVRKVFCVNVGRKDYTTVGKFGEPVFLTAGYVKLHPATELKAVKDHLLLEIKKSQEDDYVMLSGPPLLNIIVSQYWLSLHKKMNTLHWNGSEYVLVEIRR